MAESNNRLSGSRHPRWNTGRKFSSHGYVKVRVGRSHPLADPNGYAYEHTLVWCASGNTMPTHDQVIHHVNEDKTDNRLENLELLARVEHSLRHHPNAVPDDTVVVIREEFSRGIHIGTLSDRFQIPPQRVWKIVRGLTRRTAGGPIHDGPIREKREVSA